MNWLAHKPETKHCYFTPSQGSEKPTFGITRSREKVIQCALVLSAAQIQFEGGCRRSLCQGWSAVEPRGSARLWCMARRSSWHPCLDTGLLLQVTALLRQRSTVSADRHCWGSGSIGTGHANWAHEAHPQCPSVRWHFQFLLTTRQSYPTLPSCLFLFESSWSIATTPTCLPAAFWSAAVSYDKSGSVLGWPVWDQGCTLPAFPTALTPSPQLQVLISPPIFKTSLCGWIHLYKRAGRRLGRLDSDPISLCSLWNQAKNEVLFFFLSASKFTFFLRALWWSNVFLFYDVLYSLPKITNFLMESVRLLFLTSYAKI